MSPGQIRLTGPSGCLPRWTFALDRVDSTYHGPEQTRLLEKTVNNINPGSCASLPFDRFRQ